jgi:hypothetical protein
MRGLSAGGLDVGFGSSPTFDDNGGLILGNAEVKFKDADRRFLDLTEPDGDAFPLRDADEMTIS